MNRSVLFSALYYAFARPFATLFFCGYSRFAPGTVGSAVTLFPVLLLLFFQKPYYDIFFSDAVFFPFVVILYIVGTLASSVYMRYTQRHDAKEIVIDEVLGQLISIYLPFRILDAEHLASLNFEAFLVLLSFIFFRAFDILKPWPVSFFDKKIHNAHGVMLDDAMAGIYAGAITSFALTLM